MKLVVIFLTSLLATAVFADDAPMPDFFCGSDLPSNSGFVEASDKSCADGSFAAKADPDGTILCVFNAHCVPVTAQVKGTIEAIARKPYASLSDDDRYKVIIGSGAFAGAVLPMANIMCRTKSDPCKPTCPSLRDCADPKKGGSNRLLRVLPVSPLDSPQAFQRNGAGTVRGSAQ